MGHHAQQVAGRPVRVPESAQLFGEPRRELRQWARHSDPTSLISSSPPFLEFGLR